MRLWIELLKNAYYKNATELETLPNIDINIKCGNSLVSRFAIDSDLSHALKKSKWSIDSYTIAVDTYRNAESKEQKREMEKLISDIKSDFRSEISLNDPKAKKLRKLSGDLFTMTTQPQLFEMSQKEKVDWNKKVLQLTEETKKLETEIEEIKANKIYENAFEWRFEFPEVLNDDGDFVGFDVLNFELLCMADSQLQHQIRQNHLHHSKHQEIQNAIQKHFRKSCCFLFLQSLCPAFLCRCPKRLLFCSTRFVLSSFKKTNLLRIIKKFAF